MAMGNMTGIRPALWGAACGAAALAVVGFSWGGWMTTNGAQRVAGIERTSAIVDALTPYCLERAKTDPASAKIMAELKAAGTYGRSNVVKKAGWATPLGSSEPNADLAQACQIALDNAG
jgi:dienelactone hydrolase